MAREDGGGRSRILRHVRDELLDLADLEGRDFLNIAKVLDDQLRPSVEVGGKALLMQDEAPSLFSVSGRSQRSRL